MVETNNAIIKEFGNDHKTIIKELTDSTKGDRVSQERYDALQTLMNERYFGKHKDSLKGFLVDLRTILNADNKGKAAEIEMSGNFNPLTVEGRSAIADTAFESLRRDQERFDFEINY